MVNLVRRTLPFTIIITFIAFSAYIIFGMQSKLFSTVNGLWVFTWKEYFLNITRTMGLVTNTFTIEIPDLEFNDFIQGLVSIVNALVMIINIGLVGFKGFIVVSIAVLSVFGMPMESGYPVYDFLTVLSTIQIPYIYY